MYLILFSAALGEERLCFPAHFPEASFTSRQAGVWLARPHVHSISTERKESRLEGPKTMQNEDTNKQNRCMSHFYLCIYTSTRIFAKLLIPIIFGSGTARRPLPHHFIFFSIAFIFPPTSMHFFHNQKKKKKLSS